MNASQRRIARRAIAAAFPVGLALVTPMGAQATVKGQDRKSTRLNSSHT